MKPTTLRIGTRGSQLALWQANHVAAQLRALGHDVEIEVIRTAGDRISAAFQDGAPLDGLAPNGTGIFIKEIEDALASGRIDVAVHSLKDLPTTLDPRFTLAAIPPRADARDAFVCENFWGLHMLPMGSTIATTSPRRKAMLLALRPDLSFVEMRGNIDTRLRKWSEGQADALVLASAGLDRLGRTENVHQRFSVDELTPAPGQGALALETRCPTLKANSVILSEGAGHHPAPQKTAVILSEGAGLLPAPQKTAVILSEGAGLHPAPQKTAVILSEGAGHHPAPQKTAVILSEGAGHHPAPQSKDPEGAGPATIARPFSTTYPLDSTRDATIHAAIRTLNDPTTEYATQAERAVLHALGGGCQLPLGAFCHQVDDLWHLHAMVVSPDGEAVAHVLHKAPLGTPADEFGAAAAEELKARGALDLLAIPTGVLAQA